MEARARTERTHTGANGGLDGSALPWSEACRQTQQFPYDGTKRGEKRKSEVNYAKGTPKHTSIGVPSDVLG